MNWICFLVAVTLVVFAIAKDPLPECKVFEENRCSGQEIITPDSFENHRWFTPARGEADYLESFEDYSHLVAYASLTYSSDHKEADVTIIATHRDGGQAKLLYSFDGVTQSSPTKHFTSSYSHSLSVAVLSLNDNKKIELEMIDFLWTSVSLPTLAGDYRDGQKGAIVEMFGWPYKDIENECAFLASAGYMGVKVFPPQESLISFQPFNNVLNPWYFFYQPVSYRLSGRAGSRAELRSMIQTCRKFGVRVYADAVVNHMTGGGNDANNYHRNPNAGCTKWGAKNSTLSIVSGSKGHSPFYTQSFAYTYGTHTDQAPSQEFPAAAYGPTHFHCERSLNSWTDPLCLNAGWLSGLVDLNTELPYVQHRIAAYLTDLLSIGFSGFRMDAAKHMHPDDIGAIFGQVKKNLGASLPVDFISWLEVLLGGEADLLMCSSSSIYSYSVGLSSALQKNGLVQDDIDKIKIWNSGYPKETDKGTCFIGRWRSAIQNDDADQQMPGSSSRDMGSEGCILIKSCSSISEHRQFEIKLFTNPNGAIDNMNDFPIRLLLSSFYFNNEQAMGIPDGWSDCRLCTTMCNGCVSTPFQQAYNNSSTGYDGLSQHFGYTRAHRDRTVINAMRSWMKLNPLLS
eukprot:TRINITY_DN4910_c0_g1_i1.p1 TRINITY_DN4910_c0_g1~~TRINITY_DN4910_c0_g1_i1.p1  ORF type:complete len:625 (+),score=121.29 TRINITY_DN4910_c0_g1_i1:72-1946(+)